MMTVNTGQQQGIDPSDLKTLTDYCHDSMVPVLKPRIRVVEVSGHGAPPGVGWLWALPAGNIDPYEKTFTPTTWVLAAALLKHAPVPMPEDIHSC